MEYVIVENNQIVGYLQELPHGWLAVFKDGRKAFVASLAEAQGNGYQIRSRN